MKKTFALICCAALYTSPLLAQTENNPSAQNIEISIYNNNLALVKDTRTIHLNEGVNNVAFEGVASSIKPETVIILGNQIHVLEQNYDYALLTPHNIAEKSVGQIVKTLRVNPATGKQVLDQARLISYQNGQPVLEFEYGIETNFDGRLVFEKLPQSLRQEPTLAAKISSLNSALNDITLAYLTNGISWKTNYVASVRDEQSLDLAGWVSINNNSGVTYNSAKVQLIAGDVNEVSYTQPRAQGVMMFKAMNAMATSDASMESNHIVPESFSAYQLYNLPNRTTINNNQTKQISLIEQTDVKYEKEGRISSPLYFDGDYAAHFEKIHPSIYYILKNEEESNLGIPLPRGVFRFYENDSKGNMQFIGENSITETAKGEKIELKLGQMFDVFVNGKVTKTRKVSENVIKDADGKCPRYRIIRAYESEIEFKNAGSKKALIVFKQPINQKTEILNESIKGQFSDKNVNEYLWHIDLAPDSSQKLTFTAQTVREETRCH